MLPEFDEYGNLPGGIWPCTEEQFKDRFVDAFPDSETRLSIYQGFVELREFVRPLTLSAVQWIDGSYTSAEPNPRDIDLVTFAEAEALNKLTAEEQTIVLECLYGEERTKEWFHAHTFFVVIRQPDDPQYALYRELRKFWRNLFGTTRPIHNPPHPALPGREKGIVEMTLGDPKHVPHVSHEED